MQPADEIRGYVLLYYYRHCVDVYKRQSLQDTLFIKIKYFTLVTTNNVSGKLPFPRNRSSPKSTDIEFSIAQEGVRNII